MLEGKLDDHLNYEKHQKTTIPNPSNGFQTSTKTITKTSRKWFYEND